MPQQRRQLDTVPWRQLSQDVLAFAKGDYESAIRLHREYLAEVINEPNMWYISLIDLCSLARALDQDELAAKLLGTIEIVNQDTKHLVPIYRQDYLNLVQIVQAHLGNERFDEVRIHGRNQGFALAGEEAVSILEAVLRLQDRP